MEGGLRERLQEKKNSRLSDMFDNVESTNRCFTVVLEIMESTHDGYVKSRKRKNKVFTAGETQSYKGRGRQLLVRRR